LGAACATTKAVFARTFHFYEVHIQAFEQGAGGLVHVIGPAQITGIMVRDTLAFEITAFF
jgi:hypothetical protein